MAKLGPGGRSRALVIHGHRRTADKLLEILSSLGYATHVARSGAEAVGALARPPKVIVMDVTPPVIDALDFLRALRRMKDTGAVPVIGLLGDTMPSPTQRTRLEDGGVGGFVDLPVTEPQLRRAIDRAGAPEPFQPALPPLIPHRPPPARASRDYEAPTELRIPAIQLDKKGLEARLEFDGNSATAQLQSVSPRLLVLRSPPPFPELGASVRVHIDSRIPVDDAMTDVSLRVLGEVKELQPDGASVRIRVAVRVAQPPEALPALTRHLLS